MATRSRPFEKVWPSRRTGEVAVYLKSSVRGHLSFLGSPNIICALFLHRSGFLRGVTSPLWGAILVRGKPVLLLGRPRSPSCWPLGIARGGRDPRSVSECLHPHKDLFEGSRKRGSDLNLGGFGSRFPDSPSILWAPQFPFHASLFGFRWPEPTSKNLNEYLLHTDLGHRLPRKAIGQENPDRRTGKSVTPEASSGRSRGFRAGPALRGHCVQPLRFTHAHTEGPADARTRLNAGSRVLESPTQHRPWQRPAPF